MNKILGYINSAKQEGASLKTGGYRVGNKASDCHCCADRLACVSHSVLIGILDCDRWHQGYYIEPTVFSDVTDNMKVFREEVRALRGNACSPLV